MTAAETTGAREFVKACCSTRSKEPAGLPPGLFWGGGVYSAEALWHANSLSWSPCNRGVLRAVGSKPQSASASRTDALPSWASDAWAPPYARGGPGALGAPEPSALSDAEEPGAIAASVNEFLLGLPLGTGRAAADVEAAVAERLLGAELARTQLKARLRKWCVRIPGDPRCNQVHVVLRLLHS